ncbi:T9SS type A sorting domain-containing protein [Formosa sp. 4Alg 33]|uniref:T9SS type A sorting domain-containing protein n=1 Tax=Formosa sp. 4Alg 33 TaxID=3382189 RepID=UPI003D9C666F
MKKKLLSIVLPLLLFSVMVNAQTKVWDFGGDPAYTSQEQIELWPVAPFYAAENQTVERDRLFLVGDDDGDKFGQIENSGGKTWDADSDDEYTAVNRFKFNGGSGITDAMPSISYLYFPVTGEVNVKVWFRSGSSSADRTIYISDGVNVLNSFDAIVDNTDAETLTANYTGDEGNIYIYNSNSFNLYKVEVTGPGAEDLTLGIDSRDSIVSANIDAIGNKINISNVKSKSIINVYNITGALVKTLTVKSDSSFSLRTGLYIATVKTAEGQKSVKFLVN